LGVSVTEEDLHLLFDMALKGAADLARSSEPRIVLEMALLRMAAAPRILEIKNWLSQPAPSVQASAQAMSPTPAPKAKAPRAPEKAIALTPAEKWFEFVQDTRTKDPLLAAKIENLIFLGEEKKKISLAVPTKFDFIKDQMSDVVLRKKLQSLIDGYFGSGYSFDLKPEEKNAAKANEGITAQKVGLAKEKQKQQDLSKQVADHPMVKSANSVFKGSFKIKDKNEGGM
jgi:DNA polymerase-3 subunit gamma/tau